MKPAIFIDRDGTLVEEVNYLSRVEDLRLFPYARRAIDLIKQQGFLAVVVTNQSGIGRGIYTEEDMYGIHATIQAELDGQIDGFYFCPHLPDAGCMCRKPGTAMIESATVDLGVDLTGSWMIGDKRLDVETGINAEIGSCLVLTGYGSAHRATLNQQPSMVARDLLEAVESILGRN